MEKNGRGGKRHVRGVWKKTNRHEREKDVSCPMDMTESYLISLKKL